MCPWIRIRNPDLFGPNKPGSGSGSEVEFVSGCGKKNLDPDLVILEPQHWFYRTKSAKVYIPFIAPWRPRPLDHDGPRPWLLRGCDVGVPAGLGCKSSPLACWDAHRPGGDLFQWRFVLWGRRQCVLETLILKNNIIYVNKICKKFQFRCIGEEGRSGHTSVKQRYCKYILKLLKSLYPHIHRHRGGGA